MEITYPLTPKYIFASRHESLVTKVKEVMDSFNDPSHDWNHIIRVCVATNIMKVDYGNSIDNELLEALCLLHDVFDHKFKTEIPIDLWYIILRHDSGYNENEVTLLLETASLISWSQFVQRNYNIPENNNIPEENKNLWKIVSNADWYDAQLWIRAWDYVKRNIPKEQLQRHWITKHQIVKNYAWGPTAKELMEKRFNEQALLIVEWTKTNDLII